MPPQFPLEAQAHHSATEPQFAGGHVAEFASMADAAQPTPAGETAADAPNILDGDGFQPGIGIRDGSEVKHPWLGQGGRMLGQAIGNFGEHFGGGDANGHWQAQPLAHGLTQGLTPAGEIGAGPTAGPWPVQNAKRLINGINLQLFHPGLQGGHQPLAHVAIEAVVGTAHDHAMALQLGLHLEKGGPHGNAKGPGFSAAGDDAAVVVGEHHQRPAHNGGIEQRLTGGIKVVAVDQNNGQGSGSGHGQDAANATSYTSTSELVAGLSVVAFVVAGLSAGLSGRGRQVVGLRVGWRAKRGVLEQLCASRKMSWRNPLGHFEKSK